MDAAAARRMAIGSLDEVLAGRMRRIGELRKTWPDPGADFLLRRARQEAEHYLATKGPAERRIVELMR